ncbi:MAG: hypothetical protein MUE46_06220 [Xanthomonadales bacterium]|nr:hypothetical protein [Xanthomonadales bacterium]
MPRAERAGAHRPRRELLRLLAAGLSAPALADSVSRERLARLYGRVRVVEHHPDYRVRIVEHHPDLRVRWVEHHADGPGRWIKVEHHPDFTIRFVEHHADFTIQLVEHFPGLP